MFRDVRNTGNPENGSEKTAETRRPRSIGILMHDSSSPDQKVGKWASKFRDGATVVRINSYHLPDKPPEGVTEVFMESGAEPKFFSPEHQQNWAGVTFEKLMFSRDGRTISFIPGYRKATDFELREIKK